MFKVKYSKQRGLQTPRFYTYYICYPKSKGEECLFLKQVNRIAKKIPKTIDKNRLTDNDLIQYLKLHNLIKKVKPWDYDRIIRCIAEYCFENGRLCVKMEEWEVRCKVNRYIKRIMRNIGEAAVVACLKDNSCPYAPLISDIAKRIGVSILMEKH